jgi:hypothetical protein
MRMLYNPHPEHEDQEIQVLGVIMRTKCSYFTCAEDRLCCSTDEQQET